jgi:hypothetical protein
VQFDQSWARRSPHTGFVKLSYANSNAVTGHTGGRPHYSMQMVKLPLILVSSIMVAVGIGTVFSRIYPKTEIDFSLAFLFIVVALLLVLSVYVAWQAIRRKKT